MVMPYEYDRWRRGLLRNAAVDGMTSPVECGFCGRVYDLGAVEVTARFADCSVWTTPCCKRPGVDDRPPWPGGQRAYRELR